MTIMTVFEQSGRAAPIGATDDFEDIQARLGALGFGLERCPAGVALPEEADEVFVLEAYAGTMRRLAEAGGFRCADVFRLLPNASDRGEVREKYLAEHTHDHDEVRFIVEGGGLFYFRAGTRVMELRVRRGDIVRVPAGAPHWFDTGDAPFCTAIRLFAHEGGWVGALTGDDIGGCFVDQRA
jgi:1,2-dihydroxy-3-keto-5-methylthiopentene dioxygenase